MKKQYLVYQAYGSQSILQEAIFSVYSFLRLSEKMISTDVFIYTDNADYLKAKLPNRVQFIDLSDDKKRQWKGKHQFVHRLKIEMLKDFCLRIEPDAAVLYADTDTFFRVNPQILFEAIHQNTFLMHEAEGTLASEANPILRKTHRFVKGKTFATPTNPVKVAGTTMMYNAGVLGFKANAISVLDEVLALTDVMYPVFPKHIVEQLAFSFYFQQKTLRTAHQEVLHYWNFKEFRTVLSHFFSYFDGKTPEQLSLLAQNLDIARLMLPKQEYEKLPKIIRQFRKLIGKTWQMPYYHFK